MGDTVIQDLCVSSGQRWEFHVPLASMHQNTWKIVCRNTVVSFLKW